MKKVYLSAALLAFMGVGSANAQDIYKVEQLSSQDLDGDARFVGMGGAMGALGANISAMGSNPASTGLYRRSDVALTAGFVQTPHSGTLLVGPNRTRATFDQAGFVYACNLGNTSGVKFVNVGFNYRQSRNLKSYFGLDGIRLQDGLSQSWQFRDLAANLNNQWLDLGNDEDSELTTPATLLAYDTYYIDAVDENGESVGNREVRIDDYVKSFANRYNYHRAQWGGVQDYDFNLSLNLNERVYLGASLTIHNVDIHNATLYEEELYQNNNVNDTGNYSYYTEESVTGMGVDGKFGVIMRPIEESPFRIGLAITTPTAFDLESRSYGLMSTPYADNNGNSRSEQDVRLTNNYRIRTPWKLDLSAATTIGNYLAIDAEYQLQVTQSAAVRYDDSEGYYTSYGSGCHTDTDLQDELGKYYNNVHTFRLGIEGRLSSEFSARVGYNYVSAPFSEKAFLNQYLPNSSSYYYALNTDYVNPGPVNRVTLGLGYRHKNFYLDAAYLHQLQDATAYAFHYGKDDRFDSVNALHGETIGMHRNQFIITMGYKF